MSAGECNALQHSFKSSCSQDLEEIDNLPEDDKLTFLSDLGKIHLTKKFYICTNHILELKNRKHNRLRVTYCQIAECLSSHKGVQRKSDRHLTFPTVQKIYENYGSVIPVGTGKVLPWDKIDCPISNLELSTICDWEDGELSRLSIQEDSNNRDDSGHPVKKQQTFECPKEDCLRTFKTVKLLDEHVTLGDCTYRPSKFCLKDKAKNLYSEKLLSLFPSKQIRTSNEKSVYLNSTRAMQMGWALKVSKTRTNFTDGQLSYMLDKYNQGKFTGRKVDPYVAAAEMRGNEEFKREEFLSGQQIGSHFSRLCQRDRKTSSEDYEAAKFEENKETLKQKIANLLD